MAVEPEVVIEFNKMLSEHIDALWKIAGGLIVIDVLVIAHTLVLQQKRFHQSAVAWFLSLSAVAAAASIVFGYFADASAILHFQTYATGGEWAPSKVAETLNFFQIIALTVGFVIFVIVFFFYSLALAAAITKIKIPVGGQHE